MYTLEIRRLFWPFPKKYSVSAHAWEDGRIIINLTDGSQVHYQGYAVSSLKVYNDFHDHLASLRAAKQRELEERERRDAIEIEVERRLAERRQQRPEPLRVAAEEHAPVMQEINSLPIAQTLEPDLRAQLSDEVLKRATQRFSAIFPQS